MLILSLALEEEARPGFSGIQSLPKVALSRVMADGSSDVSYQGDGNVVAYVQYSVPVDAVVQADGRVLVLGDPGGGPPQGWTITRFCGEPACPGVRVDQTILGNGGNNVLKATFENDSVNAGSGANTVYGYSGNDALIGVPGSLSFGPCCLLDSTTM